MTIHSWLINTSKQFKDAGLTTAQLDAEVLLAEFLQKDRSWLHAHPELSLQEALQGASLHRSKENSLPLMQGASLNFSLNLLEEMVERRKRHEPIAYIIGKQEFYGRDFIVNKDVMVPRPETETMLELLLNQVYRLQITDYGKMPKKTVHSKQFTVNNPTTFVDVGTGSGCIIISLALEHNCKQFTVNSKLFGIDISKPALKIAKQNTKKHKVNVEFLHGNLLEPLFNSKQFTVNSNLVVLANLPYVPNNYPVNKATKHEPKIALFSGDDGLNHYRQLFEQLSKFTVYNLRFTVLTESLTEQHKELKKIAKKAGFKQTKEKDLIQVFVRPSTL